MKVVMIQVKQSEDVYESQDEHELSHGSQISEKGETGGAIALR